MCKRKCNLQSHSCIIPLLFVFGLFETIFFICTWNIYDNSFPTTVSIPCQCHTFAINVINHTTPHHTSIIRSVPPNPAQRVVVSISATADEIKLKVNKSINWILSNDQTYSIDAFYLQIPYLQIRNNNKLYPSTAELHQMFPQSKVIINRLFVDYGPMTRYIGIMEIEQNPETIIITFDVDIESKKQTKDFIHKFVKHAKYDPDSWWMMQGETPVYSISQKQITHIDYTRFPIVYDDDNGIAWEHRTVYRAVSGVAFKRALLDNIWYNATDYYEGCFWDDDHWISFNLARNGVVVKRIAHYEEKREKRRLGTLSKINMKLNSKKVCTEKIMQKHPDVWKDARVP